MQTEHSVVVTFESFKETCRHLAAMIERNYKPRMLFGVSRGGLLSALWISHYIERKLPIFPIYVNGACPHCDNLHLVSSPVASPSKEDVIIDDIYDSGKTYKDLTYWYDSYPMVFVYSKKEYFKTNSSKNIVVGDQILTDEYLYLPFESHPKGIDALMY